MIAATGVEHRTAPDLGSRCSLRPVTASVRQQRPMDRGRYEMDAETLIKARIAALRSLTFDRASALPETAGEEALVAGRQVRLTTFRQRVRPEEILVTVQPRGAPRSGLALSTRRRVLYSTVTVRFGTHPERSSLRPVDSSALLNRPLERAGANALADIPAVSAGRSAPGR